MKSFLKRLLPKRITQFLSQVKLNFQFKTAPLAARKQFLTSIYYTLVNSSFKAEHAAVLKGQVEYRKRINDVRESSYLVRRNVHRIEKGLIMKPRRSLFAESFILETVNAYKSSLKSPSLCLEELKWSTDVLSEYFSIVDETSVTRAAKDVFFSCKADEQLTDNPYFEESNSKFKPYRYEQLTTSKVKFSELGELFKLRRSVRWYLDKEVDVSDVQEAANIASFAPSACNRQPYRFLFCNEAVKTLKIAKCVGGTAGFAENIKSIAVVVGDLSAYPYERDRHLIYIDGSLASMQFMLALQTKGLSTLAINWPDSKVNEAKIRRIVDLQDHERIVMLIAIGYADPDGGIPFSQKKQNELVLQDISK